MSPGNQYPPVQTSIPTIVGSPEGVLYAPPGFMVIDGVACNLYIKQSPVDSNLTWALLQSAVVGGGGPNLIGDVDPENVVAAPPGSRYFATISQKDFVKGSGTAKTGWV